MEQKSVEFLVQILLYHPVFAEAYMCTRAVVTEEEEIQGHAGLKFD